ncbi:hypothetical protein [Mucilaginibacter frigoritolerans]|jgi:hypothetical protein|nr:hypothetical protein [Mucilaginibacter frigoritolerans]
MKTFKFQMITIIVLTFGLIQTSNAQKQQSGLYLTYNDYVNHKLSYTADKIKKNEFIGSKNVTVVGNGKKTVLAKDQLFGYHDADNKDYRFQDGKAYQIVDTTGFYIYSYDKLVQQGKGPKPTKVYYFSKKSVDAIQPLTPENIAVAFPKNTKFKNMVELASKSDIKLDAYDAQSNEFKIKELYSESLQ